MSSAAAAGAHAAPKPPATEHDPHLQTPLESAEAYARLEAAFEESQSALSRANAGLSELCAFLRPILGAQGTA
jgi:hypothetical protein